MSGNTHAYNEFQSAQGGHNVLTDPGTAGIIDLESKSGATLVLLAATSSVTLPVASAGVTLYVIGTAAQTVKQVGAGSTVITLADGESGLLVCHGAVWSGDVFKQTGAT